MINHDGNNNCHNNKNFQASKNIYIFLKYSKVKEKINDIYNNNNNNNNDNNNKNNNYIGRGYTSPFTHG